MHLVSALPIECHLEYKLGNLETFVLAYPRLIWKYALWHHFTETTPPTGQTDGAEAARG